MRHPLSSPAPRRSLAESRSVPLDTIALLESAEVADVMCRTVPQARQDTPVADVEWLLAQQTLPAVVVLDANRRLVGVVTKSDLLRARHAQPRPEPGAGAAADDQQDLQRVLGEAEDEAEEQTMVARGLAEPQDRNPGFHVEQHAALTAGDVMTREPVVASPEMSLGHALTLLAFEGISSLPVVIGRGAFDDVVGLIDARHIVQWLAERTGYLRPQARAGVVLFSEWRERRVPAVRGCAACEPRCPEC